MEETKVNADQRKPFRSWTGRFFPYIGFLEDQVDRLKSENAVLLDRILMVSTGLGYSQLTQPGEFEQPKNTSFGSVEDWAKAQEAESLERYEERIRSERERVLAEQREQNEKAQAVEEQSNNGSKPEVTNG